MHDNKKYIIIFRWVIFLLIILISYILAGNGIKLSEDIKPLQLTLIFFLVYLIIITALYKTNARNNYYYFYSLCADTIFALILISLTKFQQSPFIFTLYLIIIASMSLDIKTSYKLNLSAGIIIAYIAVSLAGGDHKSNLILFITPIIGLPLVTAALLLLTTKKSTTEETAKSHIKQLEEAYKVSREQTKAKEEKELMLLDKSQKLISLIEISRSMGAITRLDELLELVVNKARETLNTKISFLMLIKDRELHVAYSLGLSDITKNILKCKVSEGIFGEAAVKNKIVNLNLHDNPAEMQLLHNSFEKIKNILCIPLISPQDKKLIGMIGAANLLLGEKFSEEQTGYLYTLATDASIFVRNRILFEELEKSYLEMIQALAQAVEARDPYTYGHVDRVMHFSILIAKKLGGNPAQIDLIKTSAILHDLGKIGTPDNILLKPGALTDEERAIMNEHVTKSADILRNISSLNPKVLSIVKHHHEKYDGTGYPDGLKGDAIPIEAQIIAIADTYDAMTSDRPYRKGFPVEKAIAILKEVSGTQFNPKIVEAFVDIYETTKFNENKLPGDIS